MAVYYISWQQEYWGGGGGEGVRGVRQDCNTRYSVMRRQQRRRCRRLMPQRLLIYTVGPSIRESMLIDYVKPADTM
jgi:hypothetical protein